LTVGDDEEWREDMERTRCGNVHGRYSGFVRVGYISILSRWKLSCRRADLVITYLVFNIVCRIKTQEGSGEEGSFIAVLSLEECWHF
jgi:hypothetical protein